jgi:hypothetical protein
LRFSTTIFAEISLSAGIKNRENRLECRIAALDNPALHFCGPSRSSATRKAKMSHDEFVVQKSLKGYSIELFRDGQHCATFIEGVSRDNAEREARKLAALWKKISVRGQSHPQDSGK